MRSPRIWVPFGHAGEQRASLCGKENQQKVPGLRGDTDICNSRRRERSYGCVEPRHNDRVFTDADNRLGDRFLKGEDDPSPGLGVAVTEHAEAQSFSGYPPSQLVMTLPIPHAWRLLDVI